MLGPVAGPGRPRGAAVGGQRRSGRRRPSRRRRARRSGRALVVEPEALDEPGRGDVGGSSVASTRWTPSVVEEPVDDGADGLAGQPPALVRRSPACTRSSPPGRRRRARRRRRRRAAPSSVDGDLDPVARRRAVVRRLAGDEPLGRPPAGTARPSPGSGRRRDRTGRRRTPRRRRPRTAAARAGRCGSAGRRPPAEAVSGCPSDRSGWTPPVGGRRTAYESRVMNVRLDTEKCQGHNRCYALAPELFDVDDYGQALVIGDGERPARAGGEGPAGRGQLPRVRHHHRETSRRHDRVRRRHRRGHGPPASTARSPTGRRTSTTPTRRTTRGRRRSGPSCARPAARSPTPTGTAACGRRSPPSSSARSPTTPTTSPAGPSS